MSICAPRNLPAVPSWAQLCVVHDTLPSLLGQQSGCERGVCVCVCVCVCV